VAEKIKPASPFSQTRKKKTQTPNPVPSSSQTPNPNQLNQERPKKIYIYICNQLHQQLIRNSARHSEIRRNPASKSGKTQPQNQILMLMWRKETMGLQVLAREEERIKESGREREDEAAKIFGERTREEKKTK
jgi:hypothetical protein